MGLLTVLVPLIDSLLVLLSNYSIKK